MVYPVKITVTPADTLVIDSRDYHDGNLGIL